MFDRLIESDTAGAEFKSRRRYFLVSTVVVGALFVSAVVFSIYASEVGLGNDSYELTALLPPVQPTAEAPEPPQPQQRSQALDHTTQTPTRLVRQQPIQATPVDTPPVSVTRNRFLSLPSGLSQIGPRETDPPSSFGEPAGRTGSGSNESTTVIKNENNDGSNASNKVEPPPPVARRTKSIGVANGYATYLPKPLYPSNALSMGVVGKVDVQITIDEKGTVISAKAASGHMFLRSAAENAAWKAKFKPTTLDGAPVKVTGVIVYNFTRN